MTTAIERARERNRKIQRARQRAYRELAARHELEYERLLADEFRAAGLPRRKR